MISASSSGVGTAAFASSICSAAAMTVSMIVVVSPWSASCRVTATSAPVSRSTACSALWAKCVRPSFIFAIFASGSHGYIQSSFEVFFLRLRSRRARSSRVGVVIPDAYARPLKKLLIARPGVAAHDAPHGRVRLEHDAVNRDRLALEPARRHQPLLHPCEDGAVTLEVDDAPRPGNRRMIRRRFVHRQPQKSAYRQRVAGAPSDPAFRVDPFKVADQQQPEVPTPAPGSAVPS